MSRCPFWYLSNQFLSLVAFPQGVRVGSLVTEIRERRERVGGRRGGGRGRGKGRGKGRRMGRERERERERERGRRKGKVRMSSKSYMYIAHTQCHVILE